MSETRQDYTPDPLRWRVLSVLVVALFMSLVSVSIVYVALPSIQGSPNASQSQLQWVLSGYALQLEARMCFDCLSRPEVACQTDELLPLDPARLPRLDSIICLDEQFIAARTKILVYPFDDFIDRPGTVDSHWVMHRRGAIDLCPEAHPKRRLLDLTVLEE